jgi:hypothetical protein
VHLELRIEFKAALAILTLGILVRFFLAQFYLGTETVRAFQVGQHFLEMTPLAARKFHGFLLFYEN